jgi:hypothetical protein
VNDSGDNAGEEVWLRIRALRDTVPFSVRLRAVLKYMLRVCRIRCMEMIDVPAWKDDAAGRSPATRDPGRGNGQPPEAREP